MREEQAYERLMRALHEMQSQIEGGRPVVKQIGQAEVDMLRSLWEQQTSILKDCLTRIDQSILNCCAQMEKYRQTRSHLDELNNRLADFGAEPVAVPNHFPAENLGDLILSRLQGLCVKGKI